MKAVALFSGGLDSTLATKLILDQGVEVVILYFIAPFSHSQKAKKQDSLVKRLAEKLGVEIETIHLGKEYFTIIKNPKYDYGKNLNPCIDCKVLMLKEAKKIMSEINASFLITGEVLGQRPKSQHKRALRIIEEEAGLNGLVLRPLSAKLLSPTIPERKGWVKREDLLDICGRTRKLQMKLADKLGIEEHFSPAGGCLLTDHFFCRRLKDLLNYGELDLDSVELLKLGRHFRLNPSFKLIIGRDEQENKKILDLSQEGDLYFEFKERGLAALGRGIFDAKIRDLSARIFARYVSLNGAVKVTVRIVPHHRVRILFVKRMEEGEIKKFMI